MWCETASYTSHEGQKVLAKKLQFVHLRGRTATGYGRKFVYNSARNEHQGQSRLILVADLNLVFDVVVDAEGVELERAEMGFQQLVIE